MELIDKSIANLWARAINTVDAPDVSRYDFVNDSVRVLFYVLDLNCTLMDFTGEQMAEYLFKELNLRYRDTEDELDLIQLNAVCDRTMDERVRAGAFASFGLRLKQFQDDDLTELESYWLESEDLEELTIVDESWLSRSPDTDFGQHEVNLFIDTTYEDLVL